MDNLRKRLLPFIMAFAMIFSYIPAPVHAQVKMAKTKTIEQGDWGTIRLSGYSGKAKWKTSNNKVVKIIQRGKNYVGIKGVKAGTATISAKTEKKTYKCKVKVTKKAEETEEESDDTSENTATENTSARETEASETTTEEKEWDDEFTFENGVFDATLLKITITDCKVFRPNESINVSNYPVVAFYFDVNNINYVGELKPSSAFVAFFTPLQNNKVLQLSLLSDNVFMNSLSDEIAIGDTVSGAMAFQLYDLESPAVLEASNKQSGKIYGTQTFDIKSKVTPETSTVVPSSSNTTTTWGSGSIGNTNTESASTNAETQEESSSYTEPETTQSQTSGNWVVNTSTKKFHYPTCKDVSKISSENKSSDYGTVSEMISKGYSPCGHCKPH